MSEPTSEPTSKPTKDAASESGDGPVELHELTARYFDGELEAADEAVALEHLASCAQCQAELGDLVGIETALQRPAAAALAAGSAPEARGSEEEKPAAVAVIGAIAEPPKASPEPGAPIPFDRARRRWAVPVGIVAALAAAAGVALIARGARPPGSPPEEAVALAATRGVEARFSAAPFSQYRPYEVARSGAGREAISLTALAALERRGDGAALAAAQALRGEVEQSRVALLAEPASPRREADLAAAELLAGRPELALEAAARALSGAPDSTTAQWNRALALRELGLPLVAAAAFDEVSRRRELGWAEEAASKAATLRASMAERRPRAEAFTAAARAMVEHSGPPLSAADAVANPGLARLYFHDALRTAATAEEARALAPLADALDRAVGNALGRAAVARVAKADFSIRAPLALAYRELMSGRAAGTAPALRARLAKASGPLDDLRLGVALLGGSGATFDEIRGLVEATGDPWFLLHLPRERARASRAAGADDRAELELRSALAGCDERLWAFRCARLAHDLLSLYTDQSRYGEAQEHAARAARLFGAANATGLEDAVLLSLAETGRARGRSALAAATFEEAIARLGDSDCSSTRFARSGLVFMSIYRDASLGGWAPAAPNECEQPPNPFEISAMVDLARMSGAAPDRARAAAWIAAAKQAGDPVAAVVAAAGEARLEIESDPAAPGRLGALLPKLAGSDQVSIVFRAWIYQTLIDEAARRGAWAEAVGIFAAELGATAPQNCALAISLDDTRGTAVAIGADGRASGARSQVAKPPLWDGAQLVPAALRSAFAGCARVAVLARPPLHGHADLLPPELPWAFVDWRTEAASSTPASAPAGAARQLFVGDALPPPELTLPALAPMQARPVAGNGNGNGNQVSVRELRGVAATPAQVLAALADATYAELHVHGQVDLGVADASFLALSPGADQRWALTAAEVRTARLAASPVVVLAACRAATAAPLEHKRWSLPDAFLEAGARAVIAPTIEVPDSEAAAFFAELRTRLAAGEAPATALAALRRAYLAAGKPWAASVVLFER